jgi:hypothetical protein
MSRTLLLIGTRKGAFFLESSDRKTWVLGGPFCEDWPVYHVIHDPNSGAVYAAAASEWHGQAVWRSADLGESWTHSSEGIAYDAGPAARSRKSQRSPSDVLRAVPGRGRLRFVSTAVGLSRGVAAPIGRARALSPPDLRDCLPCRNRDSLHTIDALKPREPTQRGR